MRREFKDELFEYMAKDPRIWVVTGDLGYGMFDRIRDTYPERFINTGAAETSMMDIAVGLSLEGKIPFVYSITPFLLYRPFEAIRTYINHEKLNVKLIGGGRDSDYKHDGFSHYAGDDYLFMENFKYITSVWPEDVKEMKLWLKRAIASDRPFYINLKR